jgi:hypothetical protein
MSEERVAIDKPSDRESDEALKKVYGNDAVISRVGRFTLIHLDRPTPETVHSRDTEFDPADFFFDDCPLCSMAKEEGGHIIFDAQDEAIPTHAARPGNDPSDRLREQYSLDGDEELSPAAAFDLALVELLGATEDFGEKLEVTVPEPLAERYFEDVEGLHGRLVEVLWSEESTRRVESFEILVARATATLDTLCDAVPELAAEAVTVRNAIDAIASTWRKL